MNPNIPQKVTGDTLSADEQNQMTNSFPTKADETSPSLNDRIIQNKIAIAGISSGYQGPLLPTDPTPIVNGWYNPQINGTYNNAGGLIVNLSSGLSMITLYNGVFTQQVYPINLAGYAQIQPSIGKNLINKADSDVKIGYYILSTGALDTNALYNTTGFISTTVGTELAFTKARFWAFYNSSKVFIGGSYGSALDANTILTAPTGTAYVRGTINAPLNWATAQMEVGLNFTTYEEYTTYHDLKSLTESYRADAATPNLMNLISESVSGITTEQIEDGAINHYKADFFKLGKNLFYINAIDNVIDSYVSATDGTLQTNEIYNATGFIPVTAGLQYSLSYKNQIAFYNSSKVFISGSSGGTPVTLTAPSGAAYIRCTVDSTFWPIFQIEQSSSPTSYEQYSLYLINPDGIPINVVNANLSINGLNNLLIVNRGKPPLYALAPNLYVAKNYEISIYYETIMKYFDDYRGRVNINITGSETSGRAAKITPGTVGTLGVALTIYNEQYDFAATFNANIIISDPAVITSVNILNIGDSYTYRSQWLNKLTASAANTNATFLGLRNSTLTSPVKLCEGRGGALLSTYFQQNYALAGDTGLYNPFMQPTATYLYYGATAFWINANSVSPGYGFADYPVKTQFNATTGFKTSPNSNDMMYDTANSTYKYWNGTAWTATTAPTFAFSFAKYRTAWSIAQPNIIHIMFGTNDWAYTSETEITTQWPSWKVQMDQMIASIHSDSTNCKVIIGIPNAPAKIGNEGGAAYTEKRKRAFWYHASKLIATYGGRETSDKIYLADYNATIDREYGFALINEKPFADYTGSYRETFPSPDPIHLNADGFNQLANIYLGIIQALR